MRSAHFLFVVAFLLFASQIPVEIFELVQRRQPALLMPSSWRWGLAFEVIVFDRGPMFFEKNEFILHFPSEEQRLPRRELWTHLNNYFERALTGHWVYFRNDQERAGVLRYYFCQNHERLGIQNKPSSVQWRTQEFETVNLDMVVNCD